MAGVIVRFLSYAGIRATKCACTTCKGSGASFAKASVLHFLVPLWGTTILSPNLSPHWASAREFRGRITVAMCCRPLLPMLTQDFGHLAVIWQFFLSNASHGLSRRSGNRRQSGIRRTTSRMSRVRSRRATKKSPVVALLGKSSHRNGKRAPNAPNARSEKLNRRITDQSMAVVQKKDSHGLNFTHAGFRKVDYSSAGLSRKVAAAAKHDKDGGVKLPLTRSSSGVAHSRKHTNSSILVNNSALGAGHSKNNSRLRPLSGHGKNKSSLMAILSSATQRAARADKGRQIHRHRHHAEVSAVRLK